MRPAPCFFVQSDVVAMRNGGEPWCGSSLPAIPVKDKRVSPQGCFEVAILRVGASASSEVDGSCISWTVRNSRGEIREHGVVSILSTHLIERNIVEGTVFAHRSCPKPLINKPY